MRGRGWAATLAAALVVASCGTSNKSSFKGTGGGGDDSGATGDGGPSFGGDDGGGPGFGDGGHPNPTMPVTIDDCPGPVSAATATRAPGRRPRRSRR